MGPSLIIGVDCATDEARVGLAAARFDGSVAESRERIRLTEVVCGGGEESIVETMARWAQAARIDGLPVLLALDAPLGWPARLGEVLAGHRAGEPIEPTRDEMFRRETDRVVRRMTGKLPLDVGADRIARTAHWALGLTAALGEKLQTRVEAGWDPKSLSPLAAIEIYPAALLKVCGLPASGYKRPDQRANREVILDGLGAELSSECDVTLALEQADVLDSILCVVAGADFLRGRCVEPEDGALARKEGWIWFRRPDQDSTRMRA